MKDPEHLGMMQDPETVSMKGTVFRVFLFVCETQCLDVIRYTLYFFWIFIKNQVGYDLLFREMYNK